MLKPTEDLALAAEATHHTSTRKTGTHDLEGHGALWTPRLGEIDHAHAALAEHLEDHVLADPLRDDLPGQQQALLGGIGEKFAQRVVAGLNVDARGRLMSEKRLDLAPQPRVPSAELGQSRPLLDRGQIDDFGKDLFDALVEFGVKGIHLRRRYCPAFRLRASPPMIPMAPLEPAILFENERLLVLDKPAGWHCVEARRTDGAPTVMTWLRERRPAQGGLKESGLVHRVDRETTGCLVVARNQASLEALRAGFAASAEFGALSIQKTYLALLRPSAPAEGSWRLWFSSRHARSAKVTVSAHENSGACGECRWTIRRAASTGPVAMPASSDERSNASLAALERLDPAAFDLAAIELVGPGRRHQIRAGFAWLGHPLAGDLLYGGSPLRRPDAPPSEGTIALHAWRVSIELPEGGSLPVGSLAVESPVPDWAVGA